MTQEQQASRISALIEQRIQTINRQINLGRLNGVNLIRAQHVSEKQIYLQKEIRENSIIAGNRVEFIINPQSPIDLSSILIEFGFITRRTTNGAELNNGLIGTASDYELLETDSAREQYVVHPWKFIRNISMRIGSQEIVRFPQYQTPQGNGANDFFLLTSLLGKRTIYPTRPDSIAEGQSSTLFDPGQDVFHYWNALNLKMMLQYPMNKPSTDLGRYYYSIPWGKLIEDLNLMPTRWYPSQSPITIIIEFQPDHLADGYVIQANPNFTGARTDVGSAGANYDVRVDTTYAPRISYNAIDDSRSILRLSLLETQNALGPLAYKRWYFQGTSVPLNSTTLGAGTNLQIFNQQRVERYIIVYFKKNPVINAVSVGSKFSVPSDYLYGEELGTMNFTYNTAEGESRIYNDINFAEMRNTRGFYEAFKTLAVMQGMVNPMSYETWTKNYPMFVIKIDGTLSSNVLVSPNSLLNQSIQVTTQFVNPGNTLAGLNVTQHMMVLSDEQLTITDLNLFQFTLSGSQQIETYFQPDISVTTQRQNNIVRSILNPLGV